MITYLKPSQCTDFWTWLWYSWDLRHHWNGPYILWREHGIRFFGFEITRLYRERG